MKKAPRFTVIVTIYNAEQYLDKAIKSVINQSLDFKHNVELILVNDGSSDRSEDICKKYEGLYPENVIYLNNKQNLGVSTTRNRGLDIAQGKIITFLDSDDYWSRRVLENVYNFFQKHTVDYITIPLIFFEARTGLHPKYRPLEKHGTRIVNLNKEPNCPFLSSSGTFYRYELFEKRRFNQDLLSSEDYLFNVMLFIDNPIFGYIASDKAVYYYRRRNRKDSLISLYPQSINLHKHSQYIYQSIRKKLKSQNRMFPVFIQLLILYDLGHRIKQFDYNKKVSSQQRLEFLTTYAEVLKSVDPAHFLMKPEYHNTLEMKLTLIQLCEGLGTDLTKLVTVKDSYLVYKAIAFKNINAYRFSMFSIQPRNKTVQVEGVVHGFFIENPTFHILNKQSSKKITVVGTELKRSCFNIKLASIELIQTYKIVFDLPLATGDYYLQYKHNKRCYSLIINPKVEPPVFNAFPRQKLLWRNFSISLSNRYISIRKSCMIAQILYKVYAFFRLWKD